MLAAGNAFCAWNLARGGATGVFGCGARADTSQPGQARRAGGL